MSKDKGFTLIEVLIAAIILFSALALISDIFKSAMLSSSKAVSNSQYYQTSTSAISAIKASLREKVNGKNIQVAEGAMTLFNISYEWKANRTSFKRIAFSELDDYTPEPRFSIYVVQVTAKQRDKQRSFSFEVSTW
ncbi:prepilin-type N-terminal cleavage/methylation domain-containing protein [Pseudoalteromonas sp. 2CM41L]|uniref:type IV pilus modification PilV family protein n=1 Tax=unclassified Pseudoalteromonas TaxID=194690 RepID=UPI0020BF0810|nr:MULTISPECIES: prepilin-type N-terminal cleavage/methylation domain-containing protein [unclassified Pseudoalteromonas]MCK8107722.1 prepilin-type N-terminal cleavage/methylation domain-containing protein [Pseudoalteromonas sp. 2CM41L]MCK8132676.1 prepilin-type N-terminal cleavage/methylation domain-containing protein [Pseudoalteromonas sp. 2CM28B]